jgi:hypothetical protein
VDVRDGAVTSPVEALAIAGVQLGMDQERGRILHVLRSLPLSECFCDQDWLSIGMHSSDCVRQVEAAYLARLIDAIFVQAFSEPSVASEVPVPGPLEAGSGGSQTVSTEVPHRSAEAA